MNRLTIIIKNIFDNKMQIPTPTPLGRWNIKYCNKEIDRKIDLSNEDNCGTSGNYSFKRMSYQKNDIVLYSKNNN